MGPSGPKGDKGKDGAGGSGVKYVRWGRTTCPSGAEVVYKGRNYLTTDYRDPKFYFDKFLKWLINCNTTKYSLLCLCIG